MTSGVPRFHAVAACGVISIRLVLAYIRRYSRFARLPTSPQIEFRSSFLKYKLGTLDHPEVVVLALRLVFNKRTFSDGVGMGQSQP